MRAFCPPKNTPEKDLVMTPQYLAKDIINHYNPTGVILDPSRGGGVFYDNFDAVYPYTKDWCDIGEGRDFFTYHMKRDGYMYCDERLHQWHLHQPNTGICFWVDPKDDPMWEVIY